MEGIAFVAVTDGSQPAEARRVAFRLADEIGFTETAKGHLGIVVTEAATNLLKHGGGGEIILRCGDRSGLEVLAVDRGPGMRSVAQCQADGYSTAGSPGTGLGAISRLSSASDIYSVPGEGTVVQAFCESGMGSEDAASRWDVASIVSPIMGEMACGDAAAIVERQDVMQCMLVDGLGHGPLAAEAATAAKGVFARTAGEPRDLIEAMHGALRGTRGAAAAVLQIDPQKQRTRYCGVGNIAGAILRGEESQHMVSMNGIIGHQTIKSREFEYAWDSSALAVMHSDGLSGRWQMTQYPGLASRRSSIVAAVLFRDQRKTTDDGSILVGRQTKN